ncbi:MAG: chaperonin GroEL [Chlamydiota bacterium]
MPSTPKELLFAEEARRALKKGIDQLADAAGGTLGPRGKHVGLQASFGAPMITSDGHSVIKEIELKDPYLNMGVGIGKEVSRKIKEEFGDGTTTGVLLLQALVSHGLKCIAAGASPLLMIRGMETALQKVLSEVDRLSIAVDRPEAIENLAIVSASGDREVGKIIFHALEQVGKSGLVTIEEGRAVETVVELVEGMRIDRGYTSPYFCTDADKMTASFTDADLLITDKKVTAVQDILPLLQKAAAAGRTLIVIAEDFGGDALSTLVMNKLRGTLKVCAIKAPAFGDRRKALLEDIAVLTGAQVVTEEKGIDLKEVDQSVLGRVESAKVTKDHTTIVCSDSRSKEIQARALQIEAQIANTDNQYDREFLEERRAKLKGGVAVIRVGASTEPEMKHKKQVFEDSLNATRAAQEGGYVVGGGIALLRASQSIDDLDLTGDEKAGAKSVCQACRLPVATLIKNCGYDGAVYLDRILAAEKTMGFNALTGEVEDLIAAKVIDPTSIVKGCLVYALSGSKTVLTSEVLIADAPKQETA